MPPFTGTQPKPEVPIRHACTVIVMGGRTIGINEGELEQAIAVKGFAIYGYLSRIIEDGQYGMQR